MTKQKESSHDWVIRVKKEIYQNMTTEELHEELRAAKWLLKGTSSESIKNEAMLDIALIEKELK